MRKDFFNPALLGSLSTDDSGGGSVDDVSVYYLTCDSNYDANENPAFYGAGGGFTPTWHWHDSSDSPPFCHSIHWFPKWNYRDSSGTTTLNKIPSGYALHLDYNPAIGSTECDFSGSSSGACDSTYFSSNPSTYSTLTLADKDGSANTTEFISAGCEYMWGVRYLYLQFRFRAVYGSTTTSSDWGSTWQNIEDFANNEGTGGEVSLSCP